MNKTLYIGNSPEGWPIIVHIEATENKISFSGTIGPKPNGDSRGSSGQIIMDYKEYDSRGYNSIKDITPSPLWTHKSIKKLFDLWDRWHLNDMRAGCEHQRAAGWDKRPIDPAYPLEHYSNGNWNMLIWVTRKENPEGLLGEPCPVCGYKYGTAWLKETAPAKVLNQLKAMPAYNGITWRI